MTDNRCACIKTFQRTERRRTAARRSGVRAGARSRSLVIDEPTVYLDLKHQMQFYDILEQLNADRGMTIISVTTM
jgi:ABC-type cobalamin/Fe3+-siderophores transport system ATPase subunit